MSQVREDETLDPPRLDVQQNGSNPASAAPQSQPHSTPTLPIGQPQNLAGWLGVALLILLQWLLFRQFAQRAILWAYPVAFDQLTYLGWSYETYDQMLGHGLLVGWQHGLDIRAPQGVMLQLQASLVFLLLGPSRLSAITLNFVYFALFECVLVATLRWLSGRLRYGLLLILISSQKS
jgi:hypothetical protein